MTEKHLGKAVAAQNPMAYPDLRPGLQLIGKSNKSYFKVIEDCRYYYETDSLAGTILNRMVDLAITTLRNRKRSRYTKTDIEEETLAYFNVVAEKLQAFLKICALEFLIDGMAIPAYTTTKTMGNRYSEYLGRTRYVFPDVFWCRNPEHIELKRKPGGVGNYVYLKIPMEDITLIKKKGKPGREEEYNALVRDFPEYVAAIEAGKKIFLLDTFVVYRSLTAYNTYPIPYLQNALEPMEHKASLKLMDRSIARRATEAIRHIKVGDKEYPADDDDITDTQTSIQSNAQLGERVFNWVTNHTVEINWDYPPMEALMSEHKYIESNRDIFFSLGFPRIWVVGETEKSNASDNAIASLGPLATLKNIREQLLIWIKLFYRELGDKNKFDRIPEPYFMPINMTDVSALIQYGKDYIEQRVISKDTIAQYYNTDYENEQPQIEVEQEDTDNEAERQMKLHPELDPNNPANPNHPDNPNNISNQEKQKVNNPDTQQKD